MACTRAVAGRFSSLALTSSGEVISWGQGLALGRGGSAAAKQLHPRAIVRFSLDTSPINRLAIGNHAAAVMTADGTRLWSFGTFDGDSAEGETSIPNEMQLDFET